MALWMHTGPILEPELDMGGVDVTVEKMLITPDLARDWLTRNMEHNRPIRATYVMALERAIRAGRWEYNTAIIRFDTGGRLIDGQHRLSAVIAADRPILSLVMYNCPPESAKTLDEGMKRNAGQRFTMKGKADGKALAAALVHIIHHYRGDGIGNADARFHPRWWELEEADLRYPDVGEYLTLGTRAGLVVGVYPGLMAALYFLFGQQSRYEADEFVHRLIDGANLSASHPIGVLRNRLIAVKGDRRLKMTYRDKAAIVIKSWNAFRQHKPLSNASLRWRVGGDAPEEFPTIL